MAIVIPFPNRTASALDLALDSIKNTYAKAGLSNEHSSAAIDELRPMLEPLFEAQAFSLEIPDRAGLSERQMKAIELAVGQAFDEITSAHSRNLGYAASVIAGLVARQHIEAK